MIIGYTGPQAIPATPNRAIDAPTQGTHHGRDDGAPGGEPADRRDRDRREPSGEAAGDDPAARQACPEEGEGNRRDAGGAHFPRKRTSQLDTPFSEAT